MPVRFDYAEAAAGRTDGSRLAYLPITLRHAPHELAVVGLLDTGSTVNVLPLPSWTSTWIGVGTPDDPGAIDGDSCEAAGAGCHRLRPSRLVSAGRFGVCMDASDRRAHDPGPSELFHGIRRVLFPIASSV